MRVATVDYLVTLFYDGSKQLYNDELHLEWFDEYQNHTNEDEWEDWPLSDQCKRYLRERESWQQIIILDGVTFIPASSFCNCYNIKKVIFSDTVVRIERSAFAFCSRLVYIKWSINTEIIGYASLHRCDLVSVFIPPRCRAIGVAAFRDNRNLTLFHVHSNVQLGNRLLSGTQLIEDSHFELDECGNYEHHAEEVHEWLKNINSDEK